LCITFLCISFLEFVKRDVGKQWADHPQTSKLSLLLKVFYHTLLVMSMWMHRF
jgi:hypothetical protein